MKITVTVECQEDFDGFDGEYAFCRNDIEDLYQLSGLFLDATRGMGYDGVTDVGFEKADGTVLFGSF